MPRGQCRHGFVQHLHRLFALGQCLGGFLGLFGGQLQLLVMALGGLFDRLGFLDEPRLHRLGVLRKAGFALGLAGIFGEPGIEPGNLGLGGAAAFGQRVPFDQRALEDGGGDRLFLAQRRQAFRTLFITESDTGTVLKAEFPEELGIRGAPMASGACA